MADDPVSDLLTRRQCDCMALVEKGLTSKQIAHQLGISHRTVEQHVATAMDTLGANNRLAAVARIRELREGETAAQPPAPFMLAEGGTLAQGRVADGAAPTADRPDQARQYPSFLPPFGGRLNTASPAQRKWWMIRITALCLMLTSIGILFILGASRVAGGGVQ